MHFFRTERRWFFLCKDFKGLWVRLFSSLIESNFGIGFSRMRLKVLSDIWIVFSNKIFVITTLVMDICIQAFMSWTLITVYNWCTSKSSISICAVALQTRMEGYPKKWWQPDLNPGLLASEASDSTTAQPVSGLTLQHIASFYRS